MKKNKKILLILLSILFVGLTCCTKNEEPATQAEVPIRLLTSIDLGGFSKVQTRAAGEVQEGENNISTGFEDGNIKESRINTIRLIAFDQSTQKVVENLLYHHPSATTAVGANDKKYKFSDTSGANIFKIQLDLKILTGSYEFVLIANEQSTWNLGSIDTDTSKSDFENLSSLKASVNTIFAESDLDNRGIPMIGEAKILIPFAPSASEATPYIAPPSIKLKRTISKVEVNLTNAESTGGTTVFSTAKVYKLKSISLRNMNHTYNVLEADNSTLTETGSEITKAIDGHEHGVLFNNQIFSGYMAERKDVQENKAIALDVVVEKKGLAATAEEVKYTVLLYQKKNNDVIDYNVYRNTIYRFNFILQGNGVLKLECKIDEWSLENSEIEFLPSELIMASTPSWSINNEALPLDHIPMLKQAYNKDEPDEPHTVAELKFKILKLDDGEKWKVTLTNGLEFAFHPDSPQEGGAGQEYTIKVIALKKPSFYVRKTELYFTLNGNEKDPDNTETSQGPKTKGKGNRYVIHQAPE